MQVQTNEVVGHECRHATYAVSTASDSRDDALFIKEYIHHKDGTRVPHLRMVRNFKRKFWITKEGYRTHTDKLEYEELSKLQEYTCTQRELPRTIKRALNRLGSPDDLRILARSPFLYGSDISSTALIKDQYARKWPECISPKATVASLDIETSMITEVPEIIMVGLTFKNRAVVTVLERWLGVTSNAVEKIQAKFDYLLGEYKASRNMNLEIVICKSPAECCKVALDRAHAWKPDIITIWNMDFDLPKIVQALEAERYSVADAFSDPSVPAEYRFYKYKQGAAQKTMASGKTLSVHVADRWHVATCPATFYFLDAMCVYKRLRTTEGQEVNYKLDTILNKMLGLGKLKFTETDHLSAAAWHIVMQRDYKIEYIIYNIFDCLALELLDEKTGDLCSVFGLLCGPSDFSTFKSTPRRIADDFHFFCLDRGLAVASTSDQMETELDKLVVSMKDWIVTLPSYMMHEDSALRVIREMPNIRSMIYGHLADQQMSCHLCYA